jgi:hypothetical protein
VVALPGAAATARKRPRAARYTFDVASGCDLVRLAMTPLALHRLPFHTRDMWLAICTDPRCQWEQTASIEISAQLYADAHRFDHVGEWNHRCYVVEIPDAPPTVGGKPADAA